MECIVQNNTITLRLIGKANASVIPYLQMVIGDHYQKVLSIKTIFFDLKDTELITSAFLRQLLVYIRRYGKENICIINANEKVMCVLTITGFDKILGKCEKAITNGD